MLGTGLLISAVTVVAPMLVGGAPLESGTWEADLPLLGHLKVTSALVFDVGVYLLVLGLVLMVFESFGDDPGELAARRCRPGGARLDGGTADDVARGRGGAGHMTERSEVQKHSGPCATKWRFGHRCARRVRR